MFAPAAPQCQLRRGDVRGYFGAGMSPGKCSIFLVRVGLQPVHCEEEGSSHAVPTGIGLWPAVVSRMKLFTDTSIRGASRAGEERISNSPTGQLRLTAKTQQRAATP